MDLTVVAPGGIDSTNPNNPAPVPASNPASEFLDSPPRQFERNFEELDNNEVVYGGKTKNNINETELSEELLHMIIRSVQKSQRQKSYKINKRKRSKHIPLQTNGNEGDDERKAYSRCSISFLYQVLQKVKSCPQYVSLVHWMGFGEILQLDDCCVPRCFVRWIADNISTQQEEIVIGSRSIKLTPEAITQTLGTPSGELLVESDEMNGKAAFLAVFGLSEVPSIRYFGKKILAKHILPDDDFCRCFMAVSLGTLFCPNSSTKISTKYMGALVEVENIKDRNWSKFIHEWTMFYIKKYLKQPANPEQLSQTLGGCIYHLAVRCLDFIDFSPIQLPSTLPRIRVWKGNMIKVFSDMFMDTNGKYGAYTVKELADTCYSSDTKIDSGNVSSDGALKSDIEAAIGDLVGNKLKEVITSAYATIMKDEDAKTCLKAKQLVLQVVDAFLSSQNGSEDTIKIPSSDEPSFKSALNSGSTEKLPVEEEEENEIDALIRRKRRRTGSQQSVGSINKIIDQNVLNEEVTQTELPNVEETKESEPTYSQGFNSASLHHMVLENDQSKIGTESAQFFVTSIKQNETHGVIESLMDLNIKCVEEEQQVFHGFQPEQYKACEEGNIEVSGFIGQCNKETQSEGYAPHENHYRSLDDCSKNDICKDVNIPSYHGAEKYEKRSQYLEIARSKYFFYDDGTPSFRLMEFTDDNGKNIVEPELYRPVGMDDYTYNEKCKLAILRCKESENAVVNIEEDLTSPSANKSSNDNHAKETNSVIVIDDYEMSIQCAQRAPSITGLTQSATKTPSIQKHSFVNLESPILAHSSHNNGNMKQSSSSNFRTPDYSRALIVGRRLFERNNLDYDGSNASDKSPARELLNNFGIDSSLEVLGEKNFTLSYNSMSNETDELYNAGLSLGNSGSREGKENCQPKRIPPRSKYLRSPYDVNPSQSPTIEPFEKKIWEAVTVLCDDEKHQLDWAVNIDAVRVKMLQLGSSLKLDGWLDAWLMNAFCRKLFKDNHPRHTKKHFFFNTISDYLLEKWRTEEGKNIMHKRAIDSFSGANRAHKLHLSDGLYFPTISNRHWFVFLVDIKNRYFIFLDSLFGQESSFHKGIDDTMIVNFQRTWEEAGLKQMNFNTFARAYPNVPKQITDNDCGIFSMKYMELFVARNQAKCNFSPHDIPLFRIKYAHDILMSDHNIEHDAKFLAASM